MVDIEYEDGEGEVGDMYLVRETIAVKVDTVVVAYCRAQAFLDLNTLHFRNMPIAFVDSLLELHEGLSEEAAMQLYHMHYDAVTTTDAPAVPVYIN